MPSKKKQPRTPSRLSSSEPPASPRTSASSATSRDTDYVNEEELRRGIEEAAAAFPCLLGKFAIIGRVADVASDSIRGSKIWLSETSMVAASLTPGSTVSVSLACRESRFSNSFPLSSIKAEYGVECESSIADEPGNYFVLATVFSSSKVLKDAVRISMNLRYGLGCPVSGRTVFVYPVCRPSSLSDQFNFNGGSHGNDVNDLSLLACKELCLELTPFRNMSQVENDFLSKEKLALESSHEQNGNGNSTPKTPSNAQKLSSPASSIIGDPVLKTKQQFPSESLIDLREVLSNESSKKLLQICAASWLYPCSLLYGNFVALPILSETCIFCVKRGNKTPSDTSNRNHAFMINRETKVYLHHTLGLTSEIREGASAQGLQFDDDDGGETVECDISKLGGLSKEYAILRDIIVSSSTKNSLSSLGLRPTKGVLIHGPPGTGKTSLARSFSRNAGVNFFSLNGAEIIRQYVGESEKALEEVFSSASNAAPSVVFIDDLDAIAPARDEGGEELSQRMVATLLNLMDGISRSDGVVVIAASNRPNSIEPALRRPGRLDREIEIGVPSSAQRFDILRTILSGMRHSLSDIQLEKLAVGTHGFVGADLAALCCEAAFVCLRQNLNQRSSSSNLRHEGTAISAPECRGFESLKNMTDVSSDSSDSASSCITVSPTTSGAQHSFRLNGTVSLVGDNFQNSGNSCSEQMVVKEGEHTLSVTFEDFEKAKIKIRPSAMREVILEVPKVNWEDVGGQKEVKNQLMEAVEWPQKHQEAFKRIGTRPPSGILMFGPPGCSKTLMARAVASEAGLNFLAVKGPELFSKWVGESEKAVRSLFAKARANAPSIIFFDEIDSLASIRGKENDGVSVSDRVMSQLLVELDGLHQRVGVTVIAATNRPDKIDSALLRPGRFDRLLYVGPPNEADREAILKIHLRKIPCSPYICLKELASITKGYTGADISLICREAAIAALEESLEAEEVSMRHLKAAISQVEPTDIQSYKVLSEKFQRLVHTDPQSQNEIEQPGNKIQNPSFPLWTPLKSIVMFLRRHIGS